MNLSSSGDTCSTAELSENDIPGASLTEPLEAHNVAALKWWLLCRGIKVKSSSRKKGDNREDQGSYEKWSKGH
jgi:photosystem II stability/assembly factor-like uncharacterized protein